jgi:hypothetical protein
MPGDVTSRRAALTSPSLYEIIHAHTQTYKSRAGPSHCRRRRATYLLMPKRSADALFVAMMLEKRDRRATSQLQCNSAAEDER